MSFNRNLKLNEKPDIAGVLALFSLVTFLLVTAGSRVQRRSVETGLVMTEFIIILLPALLLLIVKKLDIKEVMRLNPLSLSGVLLIPWLIVFALPLVSIFNFVNIWLVKVIFGKVSITQLPSANNIPGLAVLLLVLAVAPAVCEETLFRGVIMRGLERLGTVGSILLSSFLFGLLHADFQKLFGTFILGGFIGFIVWRTDSLYGGMLAHFTNNALATVITFVAGKLTNMLEKSGMSGNVPENANGDIFAAINVLPVQQLIMMIIVWSCILIFSAVVFTTLLVTFIKNTEPGDVKAREKGIDPVVGLWVVPGLALIGFVYFTEGLKLLGLNYQTTEMLIRILTGKAG